MPDLEIALHVVDEGHRFKGLDTSKALSTDPKWLEMFRQFSDGEGKQRFIAAMLRAQPIYQGTPPRRP